MLRLPCWLGVLTCVPCPLAPALWPRRFHSLRDFVRRGEAQAVAKVTLWNCGPDAYRRAELGPEITVVRKINSTTGGGFEVLDCAGRTVRAQPCWADGCGPGGGDCSAAVGAL